MTNWEEILSEVFRPKDDLFRSSWCEHKGQEWKETFEHMTEEFEEQIKKFNKEMRGALKLDPEREWEVTCEEEAYDPGILHIPQHLDGGDCECIDIGIEVYTDEDGRMIFKPQGKGAKKDE